MTEEKGLVTYEARDGQEVKLSADIIKKFLVQGKAEFVTKQELFYFMAICKSRGLNPFNKDCYLMKYSPRDAAAIIVSIDYFRKRAKAQPDCRGWLSGVIVENEDGTEFKDTTGFVPTGWGLVGGWCEAYVEGWEKPHRKEVNLNGYIKKTKEGRLTQFWQPEKQPTMIAKVAESQCLRETWPGEFQKLYTPEEMGESAMFKEAEKATSDEELTEMLIADEAGEEKPTPKRKKKAKEEVEISKNQVVDSLGTEGVYIPDQKVAIDKQDGPPLTCPFEGTLIETPIDFLTSLKKGTAKLEEKYPKDEQKVDSIVNRILKIQGGTYEAKDIPEDKWGEVLTALADEVA